jgi:predicted lipoprotein with Yx(FWY)xxD motif
VVREDQEVDVRTTRVALALVGTALLAAACGSTSTAKTTEPAASSTGATSTTMGTTSTTAGSTAASAGAASSALVRTGKASVGGVEETVLVDAAGRILYYRTTDTATSVCSGSCAAIWPPLLARGTGPVSGFGGKLGLRSDANGHQVTYERHPLYTYSGDSAAGQAHGAGILHIWYVATPSLAAGSGASTSTTSSGYGY